MFILNYRATEFQSRPEELRKSFLAVTKLSFHIGSYTMRLPLSDTTWLQEIPSNRRLKACSLQNYCSRFYSIRVILMYSPVAKIHFAYKAPTRAKHNPSATPVPFPQNCLGGGLSPAKFTLNCLPSKSAPSRFSMALFT